MAKPRELVRNIGISAHIDSGKTTLTERILYYTGKIHAIHDVRGKDGVGAKMDSMDLEREKGITIQSAATYCNWGENAINIIDTPGHVDFTIEVERSLRVLDGAILVLCSVAGVQSQSITVDRQMRRYNVPALAFVNKCDRAGADPLGVCEQLREKLKHNSVMIQHPIGLEEKHKGIVDLVTREAYYFDGDNGENIRKEEVPADLVDVVNSQRAKLVEACADFDDEVAMLFLEGEDVPAELLYPVIRRATLLRKLTPVCLGSAYKNKAVQPLLDNVIRFLPSPLDQDYDALDQRNDEAQVTLTCDASKPLVMLAFKLEDGRYGQLTYCRVYQGTLSKGDTVHNMQNGKRVKVGRLVQMHSDEMHDIDSAQAGDIVALFGVDCASGDTFTDGNLLVTMTSIFVPESVVTLAVEPKKKEGLQNFSKALNRFSKEDPTFRVGRDEESGQTIIGGMGELHLEVYIERIRREYGVEVEVGAPQVAYRETITRHADFTYTHKKQTGGSGQFAKIGGYFEPTDNGENYEFLNSIVGGVIPKEYQPSCDKGFQEALTKGTLIGFPVVGVRACINDGQFHPVDSSDMAFRLAARQAFREAYDKCGPQILEPVMKVEVETPEEFSGAVLGGLNKRRGMIVGNTTRQGYVVITAEVPLKEMFGYSNDLRSSTQGKAEFSMEFEKYQSVPRNVQEELIKEFAEKRKAAQD
ncbi:MAG: elongation factor G [Myxococcales bacterium]|nr:elongation factor G [Myxococcales bacterium]MCB9520783.1 elongation factor G [Myxococcales bacterium]MCB9532473.1 elongation factor G [Myxococcales bacterium]MCB9533500.1 elongation factor G [Myxococcales bacterium]